MNGFTTNVDSPMRTTLRQEGLVDQQLLGKLRIAVVDDGKGTPRLRESINLIAEQLGIEVPEKFNDEYSDYDFLICIGDSSVPSNAENYTRVQILDNGVRITSDLESQSGSPSALQESGLCTVGAALGWQEVLRRTGVTMPVEVPKKYVTVNLRLDPSSLPHDEELDDVLGIESGDGELIPFRTISRDDGTGHVVLNMRFDEGTELADMVLKSINLRAKNSDRNLLPAEIDLRIPRSEGEVSGSVVVAGVGGLGSWAMHALSNGVSNAGDSGSNLDIHLVDPDTEVEIHNLNRQVLYTNKDIGKAKAEVSADRISEILPKAKVSPHIDALGLPHLDGLVNGQTVSINTDELKESEEWFDDFAVHSEDLIGVLQNADVVLSGVDNLRSRSVLSAISSHLDIPMINAGARGFVGSFDIFTENQTCMVCRYGIRAISQYQPMSCQEDGEVPFSAIVTSTALFGALEGLSLISALSDDSSLSDWPSQIIWSGWSNKLDCHFDHGFGPFKGAFLTKGSHSEHLTNFLFEAEVSE